MMPVQGIPVLKLTGLLVKSFAKPIARQVKNSASEYTFLERFCVGIGRGTNYAVRRLTHFTRPDFGQHPYKHVEIKRPEALKNGAEMLSETLVLGTVAGVTLVEYHRQTEKKAKEEERRRVELQEYDAVQDARLTKHKERLNAIELGLQRNNALLEAMIARLQEEHKGGRFDDLGLPPPKSTPFEKPKS